MLSTTNNALLLNSGLPQFQFFEIAQIQPTISQLIQESHQQFLSLEEKLNQPLDNYSIAELYKLTIEETEKIDYPLNYAWSMVSHLKSVSNSPELRKAYEESLPKIIEENTYTSQSQPFFRAIKKLKESNELSPLQQRIIDSSYQGMFLSGIGLSGSEKDRFNQITLSLGELSTSFSNNVLDAIKNYEFYISEEKYKLSMKEIPKFALELFSQAAKEKYPNSSPENGPWKISLDGPSIMPFLNHCPNEELRKQVYLAFISKASSGKENNMPIMKQILNLKEERAHLLGYQNHVEVSLSEKMASSQDEIEKILNDLTAKAKPYAQNDLNELSNFMKKLHPTKENLELWDISYYSEKLKESKYELKDEELKPYFPLDGVLKGLFQLAQELFNVQIEEVNWKEENIHVWHPDVKFFHIYDYLEENTSKKQIASFYLDPYSRPGEKNGGAWMDVCVQKSKVMDKLPVAYLICNGSPPIQASENTCEKPSLMNFNEVVTLFHEFGHGLQHMLTKIEDSSASGIQNVEWDAVELPSQFMENWCYHEETLKSFAKHYETGEAIPSDLFQKIINQKNYHAGMLTLRQIYFGMMDLHLHSVSIHNEEEFMKIQQEFAEKYLVKKIAPEDRFLCAFSHIFAGGYSAGYYSYKWAEIMSCDAFGAFEEIGLENKEEIRSLGRKFRNTILSLGGSKHPSEVYEMFRGRQPNVDALLRQNGLL